MRYCVIGDIGGHREVLADLLYRAGCDIEQALIPDDLTVVQVGDLVHRGPDSPGVIALVDRFLTGPDKARWNQLIGNHEAQYLREGSPTFAWPETLPPATIATLQRWWRDGSMTVAADAGGLLTTHAGLTSGFWRLIEEPGDVEQTVETLNRLPRHRFGPVWAMGMMITGEPSASAGPLWASSTGEVIPSWREEIPPFGQIMGHAGAMNWRTGTWWTDDQRVIDLIELHPEQGMGVARVQGHEFWMIDPDHRTQPADSYGAVLVDRGRVSPLP